MRALIILSLLVTACQRTEPAPRMVGGETQVTPVIESLAASEPERPGEPLPMGTFTFDDDSAGRILSRILPPPEPAPMPAAANSRPPARNGLSAVERPELPTRMPAASLPPLPPAKHLAVRPHLPAESAPLADSPIEIATPRRPELPENGLIRTPSRDVNLPIELPIQARSAADRAPLDDPTTDFSLEAALRHPPPLRTLPAPFVRINLPEPFENRVSVKPIVSEPGIVAPTPAPPK